MKKSKVICFGGGTGLSELLRGLKADPWLDLTAIVTMFDSGGSSRVLKDKFGILPPGDIFRCILALAPEKDEDTIRRIFDRRLADHHTPGNIFLLGAETAYQDYQRAIDQLCIAFSVEGRVYPVSLSRSNIHSVFTDGSIAESETEIDRGIQNGKIVDHIYLEPSARVHAPVLQAIKEADCICIGPGSFYTSVLPNFLPTGVSLAIKRSRARVIFIMNLMTEGEGMSGYDDMKYVRELEKYIERPVSRVVINDEVPDNLPESYARDEKKHPVLPTATGQDKIFVTRDLWSDGTLARHDTNRLKYVLGSLIEEIVD